MGADNLKYDPALGVYDEASLRAAGRYLDALHYEINGREDWIGDEYFRCERMLIAVERAISAHDHGIDEDDRYYKKPDQQDEAAAEIGRLRGEVEELKTRRAEDVSILDDIRDAIGGGPYDTIAKRIRKAIAPAEAKGPAPAMPNGVEGLILTALESGFVVRKQAPLDCLTDEANAALAWGVYRESPVPPHCAKDGSRQWFGPNPDAAIRIAFKAMGMLLPVTRAADNRDAAGVCDACGGAGMVGHYAPDGPFGEDCPACAPAAVPAGEAVAFVAVPDDYRNQASGYRAGWTDAMKCTPQPADGEAVAEWQVWHKQDGWGATHPDNVAEYRARGVPVRPLYAHPPAPVQAAPQEGETGIDYDEHPFACPFYRGNPCECGQDQHIRFADKSRQDAAIAAAMTAALQHRGDSRGGEG